MAIINLRNYYPFYSKDCFTDVSVEVAAVLEEFERQERNYIRRLLYNKAHYSLDADDGIETSVVSVICGGFMNPETAVCMAEEHCGLCRALNSLPEIQGRRVEAYYLLGSRVKDIAESEGVSEQNIRKSIDRGLAAMKNFLKNFQFQGCEMANKSHGI